MSLDIAKYFCQDRFGKFELPNDILEINEKKLKGEYEECFICCKNEVSDNLCCTSCKFKICTFCCNNMKSRGDKVIYNTKNNNLIEYKKQTFFLKYDCPQCKTNNLVDYSIFTHQELIELFFWSSSMIYEMSLNKTNQKQQIQDFYNKINKIPEINKILSTENEELKTKLNELDIENRLNHKQFKFFESQVDRLNEDKRKIEQQNQELRVLLKLITTSHNKLFDDTKNLLEKKQYKQLKKLYTGDKVELVVKLKPVENKDATNDNKTI